MLPALREYLGFKQEKFDKFLSFLKANKIEIAGSFPLLWTCNPTPADWHWRTKQEIATLRSVAQHFNRHFPDSLLEEIGNEVQTAEFWQDYREGKVDVDIFFIDDYNSQESRRVKQTLLKFFSSWRRHKVDLAGSYILMPKVWSVLELHKGKSIINLIGLHHNSVNLPKTFIDEFDFTFCRATLESTATPTVGLCDLTNYKKAYESIERRVGLLREDPSMPGMNGPEFHDLAATLAATIRERLDKYDRRRFVVLNQSEAIAFANKVDELARAAALISWFAHAVPQ